MLRIGFFVVLLMEWSSVVAQNTLYDRQEDQEFHAAVELMQKEKYGAARQAFDNYISSDSKSINKEEASYFRAFCALNLYHPDAEVLYQDFVENYNYHPRAGLAYYELGNFYFTREEYPKAIEYFEQVPLARIDQQKQLEARFKLAYAYFSHKEFDAALEKFDQVKTSSNRYSAAASYYAGYIEYKNGSYDQALVDLQRAETNESYAPLVPYMVANVYYKQERYDDLLKYVEEVLEKNPSRNFNELNLLAGEAYFFKGDYENAALRYDTYAKDGKKLPPDTRYKYAFAT